MKTPHEEGGDTKKRVVFIYTTTLAYTVFVILLSVLFIYPEYRALFNAPTKVCELPTELRQIETTEDPSGTIQYACASIECCESDPCSFSVRSGGDTECPTDFPDLIMNIYPKPYYNAILSMRDCFATGPVLKAGQGHALKPPYIKIKNIAPTQELAEKRIQEYPTTGRIVFYNGTFLLEDDFKKVTKDREERFYVLTVCCAIGSLFVTIMAFLWLFELCLKPVRETVSWAVPYVLEPFGF
jgi:hypothetical protein